MQARRRTAIALALSLGLHAFLWFWAVRTPAPAGSPSPPPAPVAQAEQVVEVEIGEWITAEALPPPPPAAVTPARPRPRPAPASPDLPTQPPEPGEPTPAAQEQLSQAAVPPAEVPSEQTQDPVAEASPSGPEPSAPEELPADPPPEPVAAASPPASAPEPLATDERPSPERPGELSADASSASGPAGAPTADVPLQEGLNLEGPGIIPVIPGVDGTSRANPYASLSKGRTLRNGEGETPDAQALAEMNGEKARRKVQAMAIDDLAAMRVRGGVVDSYFSDMRKVLQRGTENPPKFTEGATFVHDLLSAWAPGASQYAATGNPYGQGKVPEGSPERAMQDPINDGASRPGSAEAEVAARRAATDRLREFADGRFGDGIIALVEIKQTREGMFEKANLVRSSGNRLFDQHVMKTAPEAINQHAPPAPSQGVGLHPDGIRTVWAFEGRVIFKHKVKRDQLTARDWAGLAGMQALSALTNNWVPGGLGNFDETTGEVEIIDLTKPRFVCNVRLLRIY